MSIVNIIQSQNGLVHGKPATPKMIEDAEKTLSVYFAEDYKQYVKEFGVATFEGHNLTGISPGYRLDVTVMTNDLREIYPSVPQDCYVIEDAYIDGIVIWQNQKGVIFQATLDSYPIRIANSLAEYIQDN